MAKHITKEFVTVVTVNLQCFASKDRKDPTQQKFGTFWAENVGHKFRKRKI